MPLFGKKKPPPKAAPKPAPPPPGRGPGSPGPPAGHGYGGPGLDSSAAPPPAGPPGAAGGANVEQVRQRVNEVRDNQLGPLRDCLNTDPDVNMQELVDTFLQEARGSTAQLQAQAEICMEQNSFDVVQEIFELQEEMQELEEKAVSWKARIGQSPHASPGHVSASHSPMHGTMQSGLGSIPDEHDHDADMARVLEQSRREEEQRQTDLRLEEEQHRRALEESSPQHQTITPTASSTTSRKKEKKEKKEKKGKGSSTEPAMSDDFGWGAGDSAFPSATFPASDQAAIEDSAGGFASFPSLDQPASTAPAGGASAAPFGSWGTAPAETAWGAPAEPAWPSASGSGTAPSGFDAAAPSSFEAAAFGSGAGFGSGPTGGDAASSTPHGMEMPGSVKSLSNSGFGGGHAPAAFPSAFGDPATGSDPFGSNSDPFASRAAVAPQSISPLDSSSAHATLAINRPYNSVKDNLEEFNASFIRAVAGATGIPPHRIRVHGVRAHV